MEVPVFDLVPRLAGDPLRIGPAKARPPAARNGFPPPARRVSVSGKRPGRFGMDFLAVIVAAAVAFALGALWYGLFRRQWVANSGVPTDASGAPLNGNNPVTMAAAFVCILLVAGMMRHIFHEAEINTYLKAIMAGGGIGLFIITPWITLNNLYSARPRALCWIDGGYATLACAVIGLVLVAMM